MILEEELFNKIKEIVNSDIFSKEAKIYLILQEMSKTSFALKYMMQMLEIERKSDQKIKLALNDKLSKAYCCLENQELNKRVNILQEIKMVYEDNQIIPVWPIGGIK